MHFSDSSHKCSHADLVIIHCNHLATTVLLHQFLSSIENCVELSDLICETNSFKQVTDFLTQTGKLKIVLWNIQLLVCWRPKKVHSFGFITIIIIVSYRPELLEGNVSTDCRASKCTVWVLWASYLVAWAWLHTFSKVSIWLNFSFWRFSINTALCVPDIRS